MIKRTIKRLLVGAGLSVRRVPKPPTSIPDAEFYLPTFSPWEGYGEFQRVIARVGKESLLSPHGCYNLYTLARQAVQLDGELWECGVYRGGTAMILADLVAAAGNRTTLHLFDTFEGMPETDPSVDWHKKGDFNDTSLEGVRSRMPKGAAVEFHQGWIPDTFRGMEGSRIAFAHVDVDIYRAVLDCCTFIYPRMIAGGFILFDDYGHATTVGARKAVDEYFRDRPETVLVLPTGQAVVFCLGKQS